MRHAIEHDEHGPYLFGRERFAKKHRRHNQTIRDFEFGKIGL